MKRLLFLTLILLAGCSWQVRPWSDLPNRVPTVTPTPVLAGPPVPPMKPRVLP